VRDSKGATSSAATVRIDSGNTPPTPTISAPTTSTLFTVGQTITLQGSATDAQDGTLAASALSWKVTQVHDDHTHPYLPPTTGNNITFSAPPPEDLAAVTNSYLIIELTATDSKGATTTIAQELRPRIVDVSFGTQPSGLKLEVNGTSITAPATVKSWPNYQLNVNAPSQTLNGTSYRFANWSDGGAASHTITTPATGGSYTATFTASSATQAVTSLTLINADTDQPIPGYDPLPNNATLNLATLPTRNLNIRANTNPATVGSVRFGYNGNANYKTENYVPYAFAGDQNNGKDFLPWTPTVGNHTLTATPYTSSNAGGTAGTALTISFSVTDGSSNGLRAEYFDNKDLTGLKTTRTDATVDFDWAYNTPAGTGLTGADTFSVRWTGSVQAPASGTYTFTTTSDDGIRLSVCGTQIINNWTDHAATDNSGTISLAAGQTCAITLEFYENGGRAIARLFWSYPGQTRQIMPQNRLFTP
jgi:hypothetical protein